VRMILRRGLGTAMNHYNVKPPTATEEAGPGAEPAETVAATAETPDKEPKE